MSRRITPWHDLVSVVGLWGRLRTIRPEMVHAHTPKGGLLGMIAAALARVPVRLYHIRGLPFQTATGFKRRLLRWSERVSCLLAHEVLCVSHSLREVAVAERICPAGKVNVLCAGSGNGVDARGRFNPARVGPRTRQAIRQRYQIPDDALVIGFVGRIVRDKGLVELAAAWECLRAERPDLHLLLVGPFEPQDPVPSEVETQLRRDDRVHLAGEVSDTPALYAAMDMVTLPTYREGFPNVPLEAAAMELPVVATRVAGCIDAVVDGITGTLVPPRDAAALAVALRKYASDPALRRRQGMAGRERALRDFAPELIWQALYQEYDRLLRARGLRQPAAGESPGTLQPSATGTDTWIS
jgi:glycosyltransferase involved in cell wall biosynthesis